MGGDRTPVSGPRQTGTVLDWKGAFGWIQPSKPIKHPNAAKRGGKVYLGAEDVIEELDGIGCVVNFQVYADAQGLGAADVRQGPAAAQSAPKGNGKAAQSAPKTNGKAAHPAASNAVAAFKAAHSPAGKAAASAAATKSPHQTAWQKKGSAPQGQAGGKGKGSEGGKGSKGDDGSKGGKGGKGNKGSKGKSKEGKGGKSDKPWIDKEGKREMLHDEPLIGTIVDWKGKWGWLKPNDTIDHPLAKKHHGDLYLKQEDVEAEIEGVGAVVQFMLYEDGQGLGACNVMPVE